jgi:hypothetical protein
LMGCCFALLTMSCPMSAPDFQSTFFVALVLI